MKIFSFVKYTSNFLPGISFVCSVYYVLLSFFLSFFFFFFEIRYSFILSLFH
jgi:hypothetical protein